MIDISVIINCVLACKVSPVHKMLEKCALRFVGSVGSHFILSSSSDSDASSKLLLTFSFVRQGKTPTQTVTTQRRGCVCVCVLSLWKQLTHSHMSADTQRDTRSLDTFILSAGCLLLICFNKVTPSLAKWLIEQNKHTLWSIAKHGG